MASGRPRRGCREQNRSRAVAVCIAWFEAHVRSLQVAAASCQIPLSIAKAARQKALPTTLTSTGRNRPELFYQFSGILAVTSSLGYTHS